jgi:hypothetical protein
LPTFAECQRLCSSLLPHEENGKLQEAGEKTISEKKTIAGKTDIVMG